MNKILTAMKSRRSCRKYRPEQIKPEELDAVLEAATYAPTAYGLQSPRMVVVQEPELLGKIAGLNAQVMGAKHNTLYGAPTAVIVFSDIKGHTGDADAANVAYSLLLAAHAVGLDSCWVSRAKEMLELPEGLEIRKQWGISEQYVGFAVVVLGYGEEGGIVSPPKPRKADYILKF